MEETITVDECFEMLDSLLVQQANDSKKSTSTKGTFTLKFSIRSPKKKSVHPKKPVPANATTEEVRGN